MPSVNRECECGQAATPLGREDARAPENEDEKTGGTNRAASAASTVATGDGQPASPRRSGGATGGSGQADAGSAGTRPACRASTGAAQRRPCQARRPAGRGVCSKARCRALRGGEERQRRAGGSKNRDASGGAVLAYVPSGAPAPRGTRHCPGERDLVYSGPSTAVRTRFRRHRQF
jgi:hypothetical protein